MSARLDPRFAALIRGALLALLLGGLVAPIARGEPRRVNADRVAAAGVRVLEGRHLRLFTDLPSEPAVDELPAVFDAAVPQWAAYFGVDESKTAAWQVQGYLIDDRATFAALDLMPEQNPDFANGFATVDELWLVEQPSDYYRRHLLLHEGTHAFMQRFLGGAGPGWYMEGTAELLGAHLWNPPTDVRRSKLQLAAFPATRDAVPMWGRVKTIRDAAAAGQSWPLDAVIELDNTRALGVEGYAWSWALAALLDGHPQFRDRFRALTAAAADPQFNRRFRAAYAADWGDLQAEWQAYAATLDYGYDFARMAMIHRQPTELASGSAQAAIRADRGWQSTGAVLLAGRTYRVTAAGRYVIAVDGDGPWPCEPGGVTLRWHAGRPLGELLAALRPVGADAEDEPAGPRDSLAAAADLSPIASFASPLPAGLGATITPTRDAVLYLRVNDSPAELADNAGELQATIMAIR
ncbi:MAG: hypothetical protein KDA44_12390 [Planctomycetales bacterium]|nr:hypothetical protein [Planctomycetales bacterium]